MHVTVAVPEASDAFKPIPLTAAEQEMEEVDSQKIFGAPEDKVEELVSVFDYR